MNAREIEERAARWLVRREDPDWSAEEQAALDLWLDESMAHKAAYWRLEHGWRHADRIGALGLAGPAVTPQAVRPSPWKRLAIAASIAALIVLSMGGRDWPLATTPAPMSADVRFGTPVGGRRTVPLEDGSKVELNTATVVRAAVTKQRREIWLDQGEAYFEVAHVEGRPFVVHAGNRTVTVLGTKFAVRRDAGKVTVSVLEGRVRIADAGELRGERSSIITAGDIAISRGASTLLVPRSEARVDSALSWRDGMITLDQMTLGEAVAEFNRYTIKPIVIADPEIAEIRIGGTFEASNAPAFVRLLRDAYGLRVADEKQQIKISG